MDKLAQLKDIKPIVDVVDYSLYYFISLILVVVLIIVFILYKYFTRIKKTKQPTTKELALKRLKNIDFKDIKKDIYCFCLDGYIFVDDKNKKEFENIEKELQDFKYKKTIPTLSNDLQEKIKTFIKGLR